MKVAFFALRKGSTMKYCPFWLQNGNSSTRFAISFPQEYLLGNLEELLNFHVFQNPKGVVGHAIVELGRAETYLLRCARQQSGEDCSDLPADNGSILYQFLLQPDSVMLDHLTPEILQVTN